MGLAGSTSIPLTMGVNNSIKIRPANYNDLKGLTALHYLCSMAQPGAFMFKLGRVFILEYYRILLNKKTSVVLCADAGTDGIVGLIFATLDSKENLALLKRGSLRLLLAALPALIRQPILIKEILSRAISLWRSNLGEGFIIGSGPRISYWGWSPTYPSRGHSVFLLQALLKTLKGNNIREVMFEVDRVNRKAEVIHRVLGAKMIKEFVTMDGRSRIVMKYIL